MNRFSPANLLRIGAVVALAATLAACSRAPAGRTAHQETGASHATLSIDEFQTGTRLGSHGGIAPGAQTKRFKLGDAVHIAMRVRDAPPGTVVTVVWKAPGGETLGEDSSTVRPGQEHVYFSAESDDLKPGDGYQAEISANGKAVSIIRFDLD